MEVWGLGELGLGGLENQDRLLGYVRKPRGVLRLD